MKEHAPNEEVESEVGEVEDAKEVLQEYNDVRAGTKGAKEKVIDIVMRQ